MPILLPSMLEPPLAEVSVYVPLATYDRDPMQYLKMRHVASMMRHERSKPGCRKRSAHSAWGRVWRKRRNSSPGPSSRARARSLSLSLSLSLSVPLRPSCDPPRECEAQPAAGERLELGVQRPRKSARSCVGTLQRRRQESSPTPWRGHIAPAVSRLPLVPGGTRSPCPTVRAREQGAGGSAAVNRGLRQTPRHHLHLPPPALWRPVKPVHG
jgi:hypothetical protein